MLMDEPTGSSSTDARRRSRKIRWILVATFLVTYAGAALIATYIHMEHVAAQRVVTQALAQEYAQRIQERLQSALVSTHVLASIVRESGGNVRNFDSVATDLLTLFPAVGALQLAPDGVVSKIHPLEGNEAALGHDLLADKRRNREAVAAIMTRQLTMAGPFNLVQGGVGVVGRMPVFLPEGDGNDRFWGFAIALIRIPHLLEATGINGLVKSGYRYELWRINPDTERKHVFARGGTAAPERPAEYVITVFNGRWILSISPEAGWLTLLDYFEIFGVSLIGALAITALQYVAIRLLSRGTHRPDFDSSQV